METQYLNLYTIYYLIEVITMILPLHDSLHLLHQARAEWGPDPFKRPWTYARVQAVAVVVEPVIRDGIQEILYNVHSIEPPSAYARLETLPNCQKQRWRAIKSYHLSSTPYYQDGVVLDILI